VLCLASFATLTSFAIFSFLYAAGRLRVARQHEEQGLDVLDFAKEACSSKVVPWASDTYMSELDDIMVQTGISLEKIIAGLKSLRQVISRPFSPQAGNNKIEGELYDILALLSYEMKGDNKYLGFISHYKSEGGDAARIIYDRIMNSVLMASGAATNPWSPGMSSNPWSPGESPPRTPNHTHERSIPIPTTAEDGTPSIGERVPIYESSAFGMRRKSAGEEQQDEAFGQEVCLQAPPSSSSGKMSQTLAEVTEEEKGLEAPEALNARRPFASELLKAMEALDGDGVASGVL
jgi:hypothetical protein